MRATACIRAIICIGVLATQTPHVRADIIVASPLGNLAGDAKSIFVLRIVEMDRAAKIVTFTKVADLKGKYPVVKVRHEFSLREDSFLWEWAKPGREIVCFQWGETVFSCLGNSWYHWSPVDDALGSSYAWGPYDEYNQIYVGSLDRLREHVAAILAGKEVVVTAAAPDNELESLSASPLPRDWLHGRKAKIWRIKASLKITEQIELAYPDSLHRVGWGIGGEEIVPALVASLESKSPYVRSEAAYDLGTLGPQAKIAVPALRAALTDDDAHVRVFAAEALLRIDPANALSMPALVKELKSSDAAVRRMTAGVLADLGSQARPRANELRALLNVDSDGSVREVAAYALGQLALDAPPTDRGLSEAVAALAKALRDDENTSARLEAAKALLKVGPRAVDVKPALTAGLCDKNKFVARITADVVARLGRDGIPLLIAALRDRRCQVRPIIMGHLGDFGSAGRAALPALLETLKGEDPVMAFHAAKALMKIDPAGSPRRVVPVLIGLLDKEGLDTHGSRKEDVIDLLSTIGPEARPAAAALCGLLSAKKSGLYQWAIKALEKIRPGAVCRRELLQVARKDKDDSIRCDAAVALWHNGGRGDAIDILRDLLGHRNHGLRQHVVLRLGDLGPGAREVLPELRRIIHRKDDPELAMAAAAAFWEIAAPAEASDLVFDPRPEALLVLWDGVKDSKARSDAIFQLSRISRKDPTALRLLIRLLSDADPDVRGYAAAEFCDIGPRGVEGVPALEKMLNDSDSDNRRLAAMALWHIGSPGAQPTLLLELLERYPWLLRYDADTPHDLGPDAARLVPWLRRLLRHDDRSIAKDAAAMLRRIDPKAADAPGVP